MLGGVLALEFKLPDRPRFDRAHTCARRKISCRGFLQIVDYSLDPAAARDMDAAPVLQAGARAVAVTFNGILVIIDEDAEVRVKLRAGSAKGSNQLGLRCAGIHEHFRESRLAVD